MHRRHANASYHPAAARARIPRQSRTLRDIIASVAVVSSSRNVTLNWRGKDEAFASFIGARGTQECVRIAEPARSEIVFACPKGHGELRRGDNLEILRALAKTHSEHVTLVYMDPPFLTNRVHDAVLRKTSRGDARRTVPAFDDRWSDQAAYLEALGPRLAAARALLAPHGSLVVHVDPKTSHYVKVLADEIFGPDAFVSEIVWRYRRWPSKTQNFQRVHDVLLRYRKDPREKPRWNQLYEPLAASTVATWGTTKQRAEFGKDGRRTRSTATGDPTRGVPMGDVWDIGVIAPVSRERTGYPSQKPEALIERIVSALTDPDDLVVDPYAGSGTTLAVAARLGRRYLGIDQSAVALEVATTRLSRILALPDAGGLTFAPKR
jgi:site-specific DNA-methyltransferase (adenine-specific)